MDQPTEIDEPAEIQPNHGDHGPEITPKAPEPPTRSADLRQLSVGIRQLVAAKAAGSLSNRGLGTMLGISPGRISELLNGRRSPSQGQRKRICEIFGLLDADFDRPAAVEAMEPPSGTLAAIRDLLSLPMGKRDRGRLVTIIAKLVGRA